MSNPSKQDVLAAESVCGQFVHLLDEAMLKVENCLEQLDDDQVWWRPNDGLNSIGNLLLHMSGNLRQWGIDGVTQNDDQRDRESEFTSDRNASKVALMELVRGTVAEEKAILANLDVETLNQPRSVQGFDVSVLEILFHTMPHFMGHTHQIIYITRLILGDQYRYAWTPDGDRSGVPV